ncbi:glycoside hydrolase family 16 protein [Jatrophihabitans telluris]|uniref:Glycoside hydrolase family 16 protein n=1 Tax=Jatrophihabitans telluris TaxID=2038343 RepID=A0ABY4QX00_9ACTN|nr:glycoside hydrolase family 16 protein [Jatrophihabitans telluris]UQX87869.1 glycoside hydrolase family 16 protein [Jatrophihabitans telluris]
MTAVAVVATSSLTGAVIVSGGAPATAAARAVPANTGSVTAAATAAVLSRTTRISSRTWHNTPQPRTKAGYRYTSKAVVTGSVRSAVSVTITLAHGTQKFSATATATATAVRTATRSASYQSSSRAQALAVARSRAYTLASQEVVVTARQAAEARAKSDATTAATSAAQKKLSAATQSVPVPAGDSGTRAAMPTGNLPGWTQVYADDFSGTALNRKAWSVYDRWAPGSNPNTGWWMADHAIVANSVLTLKGSVDRAANPQGRVVTAGLGLWMLPRQTYGKYEILARIDKCPDVKYAWLLWPYSGKWPDDGEIDFAEDEGGSRSTTTAALLFKNSAGHADALAKDRVSPAVDFSGWHRIGVEWTPTSVRYTLDGSYWGQAKTTQVPQKPMTLVLQTEGKLAPGAVTIGSGSCNAQVDWVVQYKMG